MDNKKNISEILQHCTGCSVCKNICPCNCISMQENEEGFLYPVVGKECINCGLCLESCHIKNKFIQHDNLTAYYGWHKDNNIRQKSSSGGIYSAIADYVLKNDGVVFGAIFDPKNNEVFHSSSLDFDYKHQRKSKYVESDLKDTFLKTKKLLENNTFVLFSGTPCQIAALKTFLKNDYENLITCDFICHGVPPMKLLKEHLNNLKEKYKQNIQNIDFRPKTLGWLQQIIRIDFNNKKKYLNNSKLDTYVNGFYSTIFLRKCCYNCNYKTTHVSDIILADFWKYKSVISNAQDEYKGISLIFTNSLKGKDIIEKINDKIQIFDLNMQLAEYAFKKPDISNQLLKRRQSFFEHHKKYGFEKAANSIYMKKDLKAKIKFFIKLKLNYIIKKIKAIEKNNL